MLEYIRQSCSTGTETQALRVKIPRKIAAGSFRNPKLGNMAGLSGSLMLLLLFIFLTGVYGKTHHITLNVGYLWKRVGTFEKVRFKTSSPTSGCNISKQH